MSHRNLSRVVGVVAGLGLAVGCTLGPEPERPPTAADVSDTYAYAPEAETAELPEVSPWWKEFGDQTTLGPGGTRPREQYRPAGCRRAGHGGGGQSSPGRWCEAAADRIQRRRLQTAQFVRAAANRPPDDRLHNLLVQLQCFVAGRSLGRLKRSQQATWAGLLAEEAAREAVVHSVVASVVRARVLVATAAWALDINEQITSSWESTTRTVERRYRAGISGAVELHLARENLASARAFI